MPESIRVHPPSSIVFLCGGKLEDQTSPPKMLRDVFYRLVPGAGQKFRIILAEDATPLNTDAGYSDLLSFESDIAQVVGLILLFVESPGSLAELGAFAALDTIAPSLLAVLDDHYYAQSSFIRNGPLKFLETKYGEEWVAVLERKHVGIAEGGGIQDLVPKHFAESILPVVAGRLATRSGWHKFDRGSSGHVILLITGLCQEFGALTISEIREFLLHFGLVEQRLSNFLYCTELLGWIRRVRKGHHIFYVAASHDPALDYHLVVGAPFRDKVRWRSEIRAYWHDKDAPRLRAIGEVVSDGERARS